MSKLAAGQDVELPGFIIVSEFGYVTWSQNEMPDHGFTTITPHAIAFTVPATFNAIASEVGMLKKKIDSMADEYHGNVSRIKERIASLLCIENSPGEAREMAGDEWNGPF